MTQPSRPEDDIEALKRAAQAAADERRRRREERGPAPALPAAAWIPVLVWLSATSTALIHFWGMSG